MEKINELKELMHQSIVSFQYKKKDGSIRVARGTLQEDIIIEDGGEMPKGTGETSIDTVPYWDVDVCGWRCFRIDNFIDIID